MPGTFIISFDCEGKWGVADLINDYYQNALTNQKINLAYQKLIALLERREIKATFAFVGAFTMSVEEYTSKLDMFNINEDSYDNWLNNFRRDISQQRYDGWFNPEPFMMVAQKNYHEIAAHGFSHIPLHETFISKNIFLHEMRSLKKCSGFENRSNMTFIYPRNMVGYLEELKMFEFIGYRAGTMTLPPPKGNFKEHYVRIKRLLEEINLHVPAESHAKKEPFICIPLGRFLNWRYGLRGRIPIGITIQRWKNIIQDAILNNKVVHLYTHPHNFITGNNMYFLLDKILEYIQLTQKKEGLVNLTQQEYVELIRKNDGNM